MQALAKDAREKCVHLSASVFEKDLPDVSFLGCVGRYFFAQPAALCPWLTMFFPFSVPIVLSSPSAPTSPLYPPLQLAPPRSPAISLIYLVLVPHAPLPFSLHSVLIAPAPALRRRSPRIRPHQPILRSCSSFSHPSIIVPGPAPQGSASASPPRPVSPPTPLCPGSPQMTLALRFYSSFGGLGVQDPPLPRCPKGRPAPSLYIFHFGCFLLRAQDSMEPVLTTWV